MAIMTFLTELQTFLNENREIYSVRRFLYDSNNNIVYIPGVGGCKRRLIKENIRSASELMPYYSKSGFDTVMAWWEKIKEINKGKTSGSNKLYLYHVIKIR